MVLEKATFAPNINGLVSARLTLADGSRQVIAAGDAEAAPVVLAFAAAARLGQAGPGADGSRLVVVSETADRHAHADGASLAVLDALAQDEYTRWSHLRQLGQWAACAPTAHGGVLVHGALAARDGRGVILAGRSGAGKSTASGRLPAPWRSFCDDTTLVVRSPAGEYWAHPWPTWSRFVGGGPGGAWDVERATRLDALFFLEQAPADAVEAVGRGEAARRLLSHTRGADHLVLPYLAAEQGRALRLQRLDNVCALAQALPAYRLQASLTGSFWRCVEAVLG